MSQLGTTSHSTMTYEELLNCASRKGPIRILIYSSQSRSPTNEPLFHAECLQYGQISTGRSEQEALESVIKQIVGYLWFCFEQGVKESEWVNRAPKAARRGFEKGEPFDIAEKLKGFFNVRRGLATRGDVTSSLQSDLGPAVVEVRSVVRGQNGRSLEEFAESAA